MGLPMRTGVNEAFFSRYLARTLGGRDDPRLTKKKRIRKKSPAGPNISFPKIIGKREKERRIRKRNGALR